MSTTLSNVTTIIEIAQSFFASYNAHDVNRMLSLCGGLDVIGKGWRDHGDRNAG